MAPSVAKRVCPINILVPCRNDFIDLIYPFVSTNFEDGNRDLCILVSGPTVAIPDECCPRVSLSIAILRITFLTVLYCLLVYGVGLFAIP